jgi:hypothetical protein
MRYGKILPPDCSDECQNYDVAEVPQKVGGHVVYRTVQ